jgi:hypothetical protein
MNLFHKSIMLDQFETLLKIYWQLLALDAVVITAIYYLFLSIG